MRLSRCGLTQLTLGLCLPALAQEQRAAIEGVGRDTQGAVTPGVVVLARSTAGLAVEVTTDGSGTYRFASLLPGRHELVAHLPGFAPARVVSVDLKLGAEHHVDVTPRASTPRRSSPSSGSSATRASCSRPGSRRPARRAVLPGG